MATWVGLFVNHIDQGSIRVIEVKATSETEALIQLDFYDYDETWQNFSFVDLYKKRNSCARLIVALKQVLLNYKAFFNSRLAKIQGLGCE